MSRHVRFSLNPNAEPTTPDSSPDTRYGILEGDTIREAACLCADRGGEPHPIGSLRLLPPCWPSKIVCVGRNYREHASELGNAVPPEPLIFLKPPSSLIGHGDCIVYPPISQRVDYEGELGIVIGHRARRVRREDAEDYIFGYTCVNDVTARDLQKKDGQWTRGKGFDTFCAVGPWVVDKGDVRFEDLVVRTFVDGVKKQDAPVTEMIFDPAQVIEFVSAFMTLEPGDLIATGTPAGVGPVAPGAEIRVAVEGVGAIENTVVR